MNPWFLLAITIGLEVLGTIMMKQSNGLKNLVPSILLFVFYGSCFALFSKVVTKIEIGIAYAIWSGVGTALITLIGILLYKEETSFLKFLFLSFIVIGVVGLKKIS